ncbi:MAG: Co2+/Mg2+ efflux protein ApaG [Hyphomicrobiales bacterium]|nr:Co2+/Mg2+ efflux protein ApaG [Hyphomicrobiales bacterium]MDE2116021.1 Co2+/Mg2+ efflux protein ApaG [Hyphomicrobiales bacterium]
MYSEVTRDIQVTVLPEYLVERSKPEEGLYFWIYTIEIANNGHETVQLISRHWQITDARGHIEHVRGAGVIGEQPILEPERTFRYTSGCPLTTPSGIMVGSYRFVTDSGEAFDVAIPAFSLDSPQDFKVLN